jgi:hypothetical protein
MFNPRCHNLYGYNLGLPSLTPSLAVRVVEEAAIPAPLHPVLPTVARWMCALLIGNALALLMHIGTLSGIVIAPPTDALGLIVDAPAMLMSVGLGQMIDVLGPLVDAQSHKILNPTMAAHGITEKEMDMNLGATILIGTARGILPIAEIVLWTILVGQTLKRVDVDRVQSPRQTRTRSLQTTKSPSVARLQVLPSP